MVPTAMEVTWVNKSLDFPTQWLKTMSRRIMMKPYKTILAFAFGTVLLERLELESYDFKLRGR